MGREQWAAVDEYLGERYAPEDPVLIAARRAADEAGLPPVAVSPLQGRFLQVLARTVQARRILEIGTLAGYSTIWLGRALPADGRLVTLEHDPAHAEIARANLARAGLDEVAEVRVGAALDTLPELVGETFDLVFVDADRPSVPEYFRWALELTRPGGLVVVDNVVRRGAVVDEANLDAELRGVRRFHELLAAEPRAMATSIQTVGAKGHDGFTLALVLSEG
ncbi:Predicted O-methyltransferase YrrM [Saccharopolyspora antimicrobica]|uniref:O-methyltransferase YrrM n=1 Tax=Saccharopolyspora antimicrobica TaxID=455193 RepID=A0A1I5ISZ2_9PSEU|nr:O-methyltransferase [Saccharopolyspora antimicrobica]RKT84145.1 putative O-methyltransferase YrrM [Saccharopolyspora antimicrobica]SFO63281.1 Predicted O-methyltransferase YrrM [Saccharopolyspora antimicrobica]